MLTVVRMKQNITMLNNNQSNKLVLLPKAVSQDLLKLGEVDINFPLTCIHKALITLGILKISDELISYRDNSEWRRGGAETYISDFEVTYGSKNDLVNIHVIAKAIVKLSHNIDCIASEWLQRQKRLDAYGVNTPHHFSYWKGIIFQKYIKYSFDEYFTSLDAVQQGQFGQSILKTAEYIDQAGFHVTDLVNGLRTDGKDIFLVDFGEDLGHFDFEQRGTSATLLARQWLAGFPNIDPREAIK